MHHCTLFLLLWLMASSCSGTGREPATDLTGIAPKTVGDTAPAHRPSEIAATMQPVTEDGYLSFTAAPENIRMYWKHNGSIIGTFEKLKKAVPSLLFAMNGGMFTKEYGPVGLYVEGGRQLKGIRRYNNPKVNFGIQPQGVFLVRKSGAEVVSLDGYKPEGVLYATQSAPMVVLNGAVNTQLPNSNSRNIRNGVGILPGGKVLLAISERPVTFLEFAQYFLKKGCTSALYLDGGVSEAYVPGRQTFGYFGVLIGVVKN